MACGNNGRNTEYVRHFQRSCVARILWLLCRIRSAESLRTCPPFLARSLRSHYACVPGSALCCFWWREDLNIILAKDRGDLRQVGRAGRQRAKLIEEGL